MTGVSLLFKPSPLCKPFPFLFCSLFSLPYPMEIRCLYIISVSKCSNIPHLTPFHEVLCP